MLRPGEYVRDRNTGELGTVMRVTAIAGGIITIAVLLQSGALRQYQESQFGGALIRTGQTISNIANRVAASPVSQELSAASRTSANVPNQTVPTSITRESAQGVAISHSRENVNDSLPKFYTKHAKQSQLRPAWKKQLEELSAISNKLHATKDSVTATRFDSYMFRIFNCKNFEEVKSTLLPLKGFLPPGTMDEALEILNRPGSFAHVSAQEREPLIKTFVKWTKEASKAAGTPISTSSTAIKSVNKQGVSALAKSMAEVRRGNISHLNPLFTYPSGRTFQPPKIGEVRKLYGTAWSIAEEDFEVAMAYIGQQQHKLNPGAKYLRRDMDLFKKVGGTAAKVSEFEFLNAIGNETMAGGQGGLMTHLYEATETQRFILSVEEVRTREALSKSLLNINSGYSNAMLTPEEISRVSKHLSPQQAKIFEDVVSKSWNPSSTYDRLSTVRSEIYSLLRSDNPTIGKELKHFDKKSKEILDFTHDQIYSYDVATEAYGTGIHQLVEHDQEFSYLQKEGKDRARGFWDYISNEGITSRAEKLAKLKSPPPSHHVATAYKNAHKKEFDLRKRLARTGKIGTEGRLEDILNEKFIEIEDKVYRFSGVGREKAAVGVNAGLDALKGEYKSVAQTLKLTELSPLELLELRQGKSRLISANTTWDNAIHSNIAKLTSERNTYGSQEVIAAQIALQKIERKNRAIEATALQQKQFIPVDTKQILSKAEEKSEKDILYLAKEASKIAENIINRMGTGASVDEGEFVTRAWEIAGGPITLNLTPQTIASILVREHRSGVEVPSGHMEELLQTASKGGVGVHAELPSVVEDLIAINIQKGSSAVDSTRIEWVSASDNLREKLISAAMKYKTEHSDRIGVSALEQLRGIGEISERLEQLAISNKNIFKHLDSQNAIDKLMEKVFSTEGVVNFGDYSEVIEKYAPSVESAVEEYWKTYKGEGKWMKKILQQVGNIDPSKANWIGTFNQDLQEVVGNPKKLRKWQNRIKKDKHLLQDALNWIGDVLPDEYQTLTKPLEASSWVEHAAFNKAEALQGIADAALLLFHQSIGGVGGGGKYSVAEMEGLSHMVVSLTMDRVASTSLGYRAGVAASNKTLATAARAKSAAEYALGVQQPLVLPINSLNDVPGILSRFPDRTKSLTITGTETGILGNVSFIEDEVLLNNKPLFANNQSTIEKTLQEVLNKATIYTVEPGLSDRAAYSAMMYLHKDGHLMAAPPGKHLPSEIDRYYQHLVENKEAVHFLDIENTPPAHEGGVGRDFEIAIKRMLNGEQEEVFRGHTEGRRLYLENKIAHEEWDRDKNIARLHALDSSTLYATDEGLMDAAMSELQAQNAKIIAGHNVVGHDLKTLADRAVNLGMDRPEVRDYFNGLKENAIDTLPATRAAGYTRVAAGASLEQVAVYEKIIEKGKQPHSAFGDVGLNIDTIRSEGFQARLKELHGIGGYQPISFGEGMDGSSLVFQGRQGSEYRRILVPMGIQETPEGMIKMIVQELDPISHSSGEISGSLRYLTVNRVPFGKEVERNEFTSVESLIRHFTKNFQVTTLDEAKIHSEESVADLIEGRIRKLVGIDKQSYNFMLIASEPDKIDIAKRFVSEVIDPNRKSLSGLTSQALQDHHLLLQGLTDKFTSGMQDWQKDYVQELLRNPSLQRQMTDTGYESVIKHALIPSGLINFAGTLAAPGVNDEYAQAAYQDAAKVIRSKLTEGVREVTNTPYRFTLDLGTSKPVYAGVENLDQSFQSMQEAVTKFAAKGIGEGTLDFSTHGISTEGLKEELRLAAQHVAEGRLWSKHPIENMSIGKLKTFAEEAFDYNAEFRKEFLKSFPSALDQSIDSFRGAVSPVIDHSLLSLSQILHANRDLVSKENTIEASFNYPYTSADSERFIAAAKEIAPDIRRKDRERTLRNDLMNGLNREDNTESQIAAMQFLTRKYPFKKDLDELGVGSSLEADIRQRLSEVREQQGENAVHPAFFAGSEAVERMHYKEYLNFKDDEPLSLYRKRLTKDYLAKNLTKSGAKVWRKGYQDVLPEFSDYLAEARDLSNRPIPPSVQSADQSVLEGNRETLLQREAAINAVRENKLPPSSNISAKSLEDAQKFGTNINIVEANLSQKSLEVANTVQQLAHENKGVFNPAAEALTYANEMQKQGYEFVEAASQGVAKALHENWQTSAAALAISAPMLALMLSQKLRDNRPPGIPGGPRAGVIGKYTPKNDLADNEKRETWQTGNMRPFNVTVNVKGNPTAGVEDEEGLIERITGTVKGHFGGASADHKRTDVDHRTSVKHQADGVIARLMR